MTERSIYYEDPDLFLNHVNHVGKDVSAAIDSYEPMVGYTVLKRLLDKFKLKDPSMYASCMSVYDAFCRATDDVEGS